VTEWGQRRPVQRMRIDSRWKLRPLARQEWKCSAGGNTDYLGQDKLWYISVAVAEVDVVVAKCSLENKLIEDIVGEGEY
jgi:hypothetical protein